MRRILLLLIIISSCSTPKKLDADQYVVINNFLTDTSSLKLVSKSIKGITEISVVQKDFLISHKSDVELIAKQLNEPDIQFINNQLEHSQDFNTNSLKEHGYDIVSKLQLNRENVKDSTTWSTIRTEFDLDIVSFDMPIFNKKRDMVYLRLEYICGPKCGKGQTVFLNKENDKWITSDFGTIWIN